MYCEHAKTCLWMSVCVFVGMRVMMVAAVVVCVRMCSVDAHGHGIPAVDPQLPRRRRIPVLRALLLNQS